MAARHSISELIVAAAVASGISVARAIEIVEYIREQWGGQRHYIKQSPAARSDQRRRNDRTSGSGN